VVCGLSDSQIRFEDPAKLSHRSIYRFALRRAFGRGWLIKWLDFKVIPLTEDQARDKHKAGGFL